MTRRPNRPFAALSVVAALALAGCSDTSGSASAGGGTAGAGAGGGTASPSTPSLTPSPSATSPGPSPTPSTSTTAQAPPTTDSLSELPDKITLAFGGDVHFTDHVGRLLASPAASFAPLRAALAGADFAMVNLQSSITSRGTPEAKTYHFRTTPTALVALRDAGVDVVTMANNHAVDYGPVGLKDTLAARKASPIPVVGIGADGRDAYAPAVLNVRGVRIAVFGSSQVNDLTATKFAAGDRSPGVAVNVRNARLKASVARAAAKYDIVVAYLHWGLDGATCPDATQSLVANELESAGADVIVGAHANRVQGSGWLGRSYVGYGLGSFVWWRSTEPESVTGVLRLTVDAKAARARGVAKGAARQTTSPLVTTAGWTPMLVGKDGMPRAQSGAKAASMLASWTKARGCAGLRSTPAR